MGIQISVYLYIFNIPMCKHSQLVQVINQIAGIISIIINIGTACLNRKSDSNCLCFRFAGIDGKTT